MSYYAIPLKAGQPFRQDSAGSLLLIDSIGSASGVNVMLTKIGGSDGPIMPNRQAAFRLIEPYEAITFTSSTDTTIGVFMSSADVQLGFVSGDNVVVNNADAQALPVRTPAGTRLDVNVGGGSVTVTADNVGINNTTANPVPVEPLKSGTIVDIAPVAAGVARVLLVSDATLKQVRFRNSHATATVAIGGAGVTMANGAIQLGPGDIWYEDSAPGAEWHAISDTDGVNVQIQGLK